MNNREHILQTACVNYFAYAYPHLRGLLFAVPNGGRRDAVTGARLKAEGVVAGVADLILLYPAHGLSALCIEMKTERGSQSPAQQRWQRLVTSLGNSRYVVCRSFDAFKDILKDYLGDPLVAKTILEQPYNAL